MTIEQRTSCDAQATAHVTYSMTGPTPTYDGRPIARSGTVSVSAGDHVAHVLADGETYAVLNGYICERPIVLAQTGAASEAVAGVGASLLLLGAACAVAARWWRSCDG